MHILNLIFLEGLCKILKIRIEIISKHSAESDNKPKLYLQLPSVTAQGSKSINGLSSSYGVMQKVSKTLSDAKVSQTIVSASRIQEMVVTRKGSGTGFKDKDKICFAAVHTRALLHSSFEKKACRWRSSKTETSLVHLIVRKFGNLVRNSLVNSISSPSNLYSVRHLSDSIKKCWANCGLNFRIFALWCISNLQLCTSKESVGRCRKSGLGCQSVREALAPALHSRSRIESLAFASLGNIEAEDGRLHFLFIMGSICKSFPQGIVCCS